MTCPDVRPLLPAHVYGDLPSGEAVAVAGHLRGCPAVRVDVPGLFPAAADRQARSARRWRRLAVAGAAVAAGLLLVVGLRLRVTVGAGQVVIAWGEARERLSGEPEASRVKLASGSPLNDASEDRVRLQQELIHALAADVEARDRQRQAETDDLCARLDAVQRVAAQRWSEAERWMNALYVAQFKRPEEKTNP